MSAIPDSTLGDCSRTIADLRRELAECKAERDAALAREAATAEVLRVINSSPGDLAPVFDAMLERATRLCEAPCGVLRIWDGERFHVGAVHGEPGFSDWLQQRGPHRPPADDPLGRIIKGEGVVHFADAPDDAGYMASPGFKQAAELSGMRSGMTVPLRKDDALLGAITIYRQEVRPFTDKQIALLQNFAAQAVIAMENARLLTETREALEQQTATAEVLRIINSSPGDLTPVFDAILEKAHGLCDAACGRLLIRDREEFYLAAAHGEPHFIEAARQLSPERPPEGSIMARLVNGEPIIHVADARDASYGNAPPPLRHFIDAAGARTLLWVPLRKDDALLGVITAFRPEVRPFTDKQIALLQNFAAQAVIAMENARLLTETREALEQQTATAEVLQVINSSPGDLAPVFDAILERAHSLCGIDFGALQLQDGGKFRSVAARGLSEALAELLRQPFEPVPGSPPSRLMGGARIVHIADMAELARPGTADARAQAVSQDGFRTGLFVPLRKDADLLGYIVALRREVRLYSEKEIALLQNFAAQAVIAMENARLITETREALEQQTATAEVLGVINSSPGDLTPVFDAMLEKAMRLCDATYGHLYIYNGEQFSSAAVRGEPRFVEWLRRIGPVRPLSQDSPLGRLSGGERIVRIVDAREERGYGTAPGFREMVDNSGIRSGITVGLDKDGALHGAITIYRHEVRPFSNKQIALLQNFAAQAVIAMENARLIGELRQRTDEVAELNRGLETRVAEQVEELGRVGRLKRFLAPQLAELIVSHGDEKILESHRREIVVVFCDLRGYTAFTETAEPEEVLDFLREYHGALGPLVSQYEGTLDQFSGDGIMVFFNDPVPCPDPAERAVKMAMAMREEAGKLIATWRRDGCELGFGAGIAQGYATLGQIGFSERSGYTAIGTVCNLAARLCAEAKDGQILISSRVGRAVAAVAILEDLGNLELRGLRRPVAAFNVVQSTSAADTRPNLTVVARGPGA